MLRLLWWVVLVFGLVPLLETRLLVLGINLLMFLLRDVRR